MAEKKSAKELFSDYVPEIMNYDPEIEKGKLNIAHGKALSEEERHRDDLIRLKAKEQAEKTTEGKNMEVLLNEYVPEIMHYDPKVDGGEEHMIRDELLSEKERLKDVITRLKEKNRGNRKVRR
ncbi:hypothetical protein KKE54_06430 [bacterium]|nr:hypothetical protein [bacterium]